MVALAPSVARNWPVRLREPSYVKSANRLTTPKSRTKRTAFRLDNADGSELSDIGERASSKCPPEQPGLCCLGPRDDSRLLPLSTVEGCCSWLVLLAAITQSWPGATGSACAPGRRPQSYWDRWQQNPVASRLPCHSCRSDNSPAARPHIWDCKVRTRGSRCRPSR